MLKIKTKCGKRKYQLLKRENSILGRLRLYLFLIIGGIRDVYKKEE